MWQVDIRYFDMLGFIPAWVEGQKDDETLVDCIDRNYGHGGGWKDFDKFNVDTFSGHMEYPGDPVQKPIAKYETKDETLWMYAGSWITVLDKSTGKTRTARID